MIYLYNLIFYHPILNALIYLYETVAFRNFGLAIIVVTLLIRLILYPFFHKSAKQQMVMQRIQPKIKKIQELHKGDKEKQTQALMDLYKEHGVNPFSSLLLIILQLPIMLALYWVVRSGLTPGDIAGLYSFVAQPHAINSVFLGLFDLAKPNAIMIFLAAAAQYFQARLAIWRDPNNTTAPSQAE